MSELHINCCLAGAAKLGDVKAVNKHLDEGKHVDELVCVWCMFCVPI
jgi:hypothetical protein